MPARPLLLIVIAAALASVGRAGQPGLSDPQAAQWLSRWEKSITASAARDRYCDKELGEELGWLVSPFANGFYQGWRATGDLAWIDRLVAWSDAWMGRSVTEPDGFPGWPKEGSGSQFERTHLNDSLLGEAMALRPAVLMAAAMRKDPALTATYGTKAASYLALAERIFEKWDRRGAWREVPGGGLWVVPEFGLTRTGDGRSMSWTAGYATRTITGFSNPANKQHHIANWMIALADATGRPRYRERAAKWWQLMKSRIRPRGAGGTFAVWNYWDPGGPWDGHPDGTLKHWVGIHPNGGYYAIDVEGMVSAFEHGLVFDRADINRLIATNRDFMWNRRNTGAKFGMIDGGKADSRWPDSPGVLWTALLPYDAMLRGIFEANHRPDGWGGLVLTPWYLALRKTGQELPGN